MLCGRRYGHTQTLMPLPLPRRACPGARPPMLSGPCGTERAMPRMWYGTTQSQCIAAGRNLHADKQGLLPLQLVHAARPVPCMQPYCKPRKPKLPPPLPWPHLHFDEARLPLGVLQAARTHIAHTMGASKCDLRSNRRLPLVELGFTAFQVLGHVWLSDVRVTAGLLPHPGWGHGGPLAPRGATAPKCTRRAAVKAPGRTPCPDDI